MTSDILQEAEAALEDGSNAIDVAHHHIRRAEREGRLEELRSLCNDYSPGEADTVFADHLFQEREDGDARVPEAKDDPSAPLSELYEALQGTALEYDLRPYSATGRFTLLSAPPKRGKSTFAALYAHAKATGGTFLGQDLTPSPALYVAPDENWRDVVRRFRSFGTPGDALEVWRDRQQSIARIATRAEEIGAELVVLDTLLRVAGISDENDNAEWDDWFRGAREHVHESGAVWFAVHHDRKSGGTDGEGIRGASAIFGSVDVAVSLQKSDESPHRRILRVEGTRLDHAEPLVVELDESTPRYKAVGEQHVVSILEDAALERLREVLTADSQTVSDICDSLQERHPEAEGDVPESTVRNRLERLRTAGLAARHGAGGQRDPYRYALNHSDGPSETVKPSEQALNVQGDTRSTGDDPDTHSSRPGENRSTVSQPRGAERLSGRADGEAQDHAGDDGADAVPRESAPNPDSETAPPARGRCACGAPLPDDAYRCDDCTARVVEMDLARPDPDRVVQVGEAQHLYTPIPDRGS